METFSTNLQPEGGICASIEPWLFNHGNKSLLLFLSQKLLRFNRAMIIQSWKRCFTGFWEKSRHGASIEPWGLGCFHDWIIMALLKQDRDLNVPSLSEGFHDWIIMALLKRFPFNSNKECYWWFPWLNNHGSIEAVVSRTWSLKS